MELRHLRYFVAAAEAENVSRAAMQLHVSQPALSRQIRDLEEELTFPLFERTAKSVRLTEAGKVFLSGAKSVLQGATEAIMAARTVAAGGVGELHVGYAPSPTVRLLPARLRAFQAQMPKVRVRLHDLSSSELLAGVREGKLQLALMVKPSAAMLKGLRFAELERDAMCVAVPPGHSFSGRRTIKLESALSEPLVIFTRSEYPEYFEYLQGLMPASRHTPVISQEHDSAASMIAAIESGAGVAILPQSFTCSAGQRLELIPLVPAPPPLLVGAVWAPKIVSPAANVFLTAGKSAALP